MTAIITIVLILLISTIAILRFYPPLGRKPSKTRVESSAAFKDGSFYNKEEINMSTGFSSSIGMLKDFMKKDTERKPAEAIPMVQIKPGTHIHETAITWFGHSATLLELEGKRLLLDPMFGKAPTPFPWLAGNRFSKDLPFTTEDLLPIDAILFTHDHYDHLDYGTIKRLKEYIPQFFVPIGVGSHLERWGVETGRITEVDWWDELDWKGLKLAFTPSRHFSGRSLNDRNATLWGSWCIMGNSKKVFYSGDGGYGSHFKKIGEQYGPFDLTIMECGQYDPRWKDVHMMPEETAQAHLDVGGDLMLPVHWGAFVLSFHSWTDPIERVSAIAQQLDIPLLTPKIGERLVVEKGERGTPHWWKA
jgi:L-ascorbate metabolism protein UlaG (beta-lactamase superfamily)